jgi:hypothetical protein
VVEAGEDKPFSIRVAGVSLDANPATASIAVRSRKDASSSAARIK